MLNSINLVTKQSVYPIKTKTQKVLQWFRNVNRVIFFPITQVLMAVGIFPVQALSFLKKIPFVKSFIGFIARKIGQDSRNAAQTYEEDFLHKKSKQHQSIFTEMNWFNKNPKAIDFDTFNLQVNEITFTPYITDFGRQVSLETFSFQHKNFDKLEPSKQFYRIHCSGNSGNCSRFFPELAQLSQRHLDLKTITYNHPGVEGSGSITMSQDDLINALYTQVKTLILSGVNPKNIELTGFSIGAATAAITAAKLSKENFQVNLFCDRTFSNLPDVVTNKLPILSTIFKFLQIFPLVKELVHYIIQPTIKYLIVKPILWILNWDMNPAVAYMNVSPSRKALATVKPESMGKKNTLIKKTGKYLGLYTGLFKKNNGDKTIMPHVSLHEGSQRKTKKNQWKLEFEQLKIALLNNNDKNAIQGLIASLKDNSDNAISANALSRLNSIIDIENNKLNNFEMLCLIEIGTKASKLQGVKESDAHNVNADKIFTRNFHSSTEVLKAANLPNDLPKNLLTYYSLFHQAIKSCNDLETMSGLSLN